MLKKNDTYSRKSHSNLLCHCRVVSKHELTKRFNVYLNFTVTCSVNSLVYKRELTSRQEEIYELIKSLHDSGLGYRRIAKRLRDMNIKTARGSVFKNNNVFAVIKRYAERQARLERHSYTSEMKFSKMKLEWLKES